MIVANLSFFGNLIGSYYILNKVKDINEMIYVGLVLLGLLTVNSIHFYNVGKKDHV